MMRLRKKQRQRKQGRVLVWICTLIFIAGLINYLRPLPGLSVSKSPPLPKTAATDMMPWPSDSTAAIGAEGYGVLAASSQSQTPVPTASIAKIITALSILKQKPLNLNQQGPVLTLTQNDVNSYDNYYAVGGSIVKVAVGEKITEYQALQAMLLPSANNMADTLAIWAFGSLPNYSAYANQFVSQLHMTHTTIGTDASGLSPTTTSTPSDLILLGEVALQNPVIAQIVSQTNATIPVAGTIPNVNHLLGKDGINGIKTGNSDEARGCILYSAVDTLASGKQVTIIGAIMGAPSLARASNEVLPLLDAAKSAFSLDTVVHANQSYGDVYVPWSNSIAHAIAQYDASAITWQHTISPLAIDLQQVQHSSGKSKQIGSVQLSSEGGSTGVPLVLDRSISGPGFWWRLVRW